MMRTARLTSAASTIATKAAISCTPIALRHIDASFATGEGLWQPKAPEAGDFGSDKALASRCQPETKSFPWPAARDFVLAPVLSSGAE
jgi:hypothetical protein